MSRTKLRAVSPDEKPESAEPKSLAEAVEGGNYMEILVAQRREIAHAIPDEKGPAKAALHRQLSLVAKEIRALESKAREESAEDGGPVADEAWEAI